MSVSVHINGVRDPEDGLREMAELVLRCRKLGFDPPKEVADALGEAVYLGNVDEIVRFATEVSLKYNLKIDGLIEGDAEYGNGVVVDLTKLPPDIKKLRVYMS